MMNIQCLFLSSLLLFSLLGLVVSSDSSIQEKCSQEFTKLTMCLDYASAKSDTPSGSCCSSISDMREKDPVCLCYIIQQTHNGVSSLKSLGVQFTRLVQLPSACKLANSSISDCPKLLNLSPSSPDYAIFTNTSTGAAAVAATGSGTNPKSNEAMRGVSFTGSLVIAIASAISLSFFYIEA